MICLFILRTILPDDSYYSLQQSLLCTKAVLIALRFHYLASGKMAVSQYLLPVHGKLWDVPGTLVLHLNSHPSSWAHGNSETPFFQLPLQLSSAMWHVWFVESD